MRRRAAGETVEQFRQRRHEPQGHEIRDQLAEVLAPHVDELREAWPEMPPEVQDRTADCWEPLLAIADLAGGDWPEVARVAAVAHVADRKANERETLGVRLLTDLFEIFHYTTTTNNNNNQQRHEHLSTEVVLGKLNEKDESPWGDLRGKPLDARGLSRRLSKYGVKPHNVRVGAEIAKGYSAGDIHDPWTRYTPHLLPESSTDSSPDLSATSATSVFDPVQSSFIDLSDTACDTCGEYLSTDRHAFGKTNCSTCEKSAVKL